MYDRHPRTSQGNASCPSSESVATGAVRGYNMGVGSSRSEQAESLASAEKKIASLTAQSQELKSRVQQQAAEIAKQSNALDAAGRDYAEQLRMKQAAVEQARRQQQLAEDLRTNDALLAKRLMHAQLRATPGQPSGDSFEAGALAAQDVLQYREVLVHTARELDTARADARASEAAALATRRAELAKDLWLPNLCDVSLTLRSSQGLLLAGLRAPREPAPGVHAGGVSPGVAILRHFGKPAAHGQWAALGGSLLWDAKVHAPLLTSLALLSSLPVSGHPTYKLGPAQPPAPLLKPRLFETLCSSRH